MDTFGHFLDAAAMVYLKDNHCYDIALFTFLIFTH